VLFFYRFDFFNAELIALICPSLIFCLPDVCNMVLTGNHLLADVSEINTCPSSAYDLRRAKTRLRVQKGDTFYFSVGEVF